MSAILGGDKPAVPPALPGIGGHTCGSCDFWNKQPAKEGESEVGQCRAKPPTVFMVGITGLRGPQPAGVAFWPQTMKAEACGDHPEVAKGRAVVIAAAAKIGMENALFYDKEQRDMSRKPTPEEMERMARAVAAERKIEPR